MKFELNKTNISLFFMVLAFIMIILPKNSNEEVSVKENKEKEVEVASVLDIYKERPALPLLGEVSSESEVSVRAESQGGIKSLYVSQGEYISQGQIIAEIENASQRAAVLQAEAAVEAAKASFQKTESGSREEQLDILKTRLENANDALIESKTSVINTIKNIYFTESDDIYNKIDVYYRNPKTSPEINMLLTDFQLEVDLNWRRVEIGTMMRDWESLLNGISKDSDLLSYLNKAEKNVSQIRGFLDKAILVPDTDSSPDSYSGNTVAGWKSTVLSARANVSSALASISAQKNDLNAKIAARDIATFQYEEGVSGNRTEDITASEAGLKQAMASLYATEVNLEKTIIRSPIAGTVNKLNIERGAFVSVYEEIAIISNNLRLEIITFITKEDRKTIKVGSKAKIDGVWNGVVSEIAPAFDLNTKKIEVKIAVSDGDAGFTSGQSVKLEVEREFSGEYNNIISDEIIIPVSAIKVTSDGNSVFTVSTDNKLLSHKVELGPIAGNGIIIKNGISYDMEIVTDARGLSEGEKVVVKK